MQEISIQQLEAEALQLLTKGEFEEAAKRFLQIKDIEPENLSLLSFSAMVAMQRKQYQIATEMLIKLTSAQPSNEQAWFNLAMAHYAIQNNTESVKALDESLKLNPNQIASHIYRGAILDQEGNKRESLRSFIQAIRIADGRPMEVAAELRPALAKAAAIVKRELSANIEFLFQPISKQYGAGAFERVREAAAIFCGEKKAKFAHPKWLPGLFYIPDLPTTMFFDAAVLPQLQRLEQATEIIKAELLSVMNDDFGFAPYINHPFGSKAAETWKDLNQSNSWSTYHFCKHGEVIKENVSKCPKTWSILSEMDLMRIPGYGPEPMFSVLAPHTHIKAHHGAVNGRVIVHLPLIVPANCGAIRVGSEQRSWQVGKCLAFDDSFEHEAWNESNETRVVLILDVWNPHLSCAEREAFTALHIAAQEFEKGVFRHI